MPESVFQAAQAIVYVFDFPEQHFLQAIDSRFQFIHPRFESADAVSETPEIGVVGAALGVELGSDVRAQIGQPVVVDENADEHGQRR